LSALVALPAFDSFRSSFRHLHSETQSDWQLRWQILTRLKSCFWKLEIGPAHYKSPWRSISKLCDHTSQRDYKSHSFCKSKFQCSLRHFGNTLHLSNSNLSFSSIREIALVLRAMRPQTNLSLWLQNYSRYFEASPQTPFFSCPPLHFFYPFSFRDLRLGSRCY